MAIVEADISSGDPKSSAGKKSEGTFLQCVVVTPERTLIDSTVDFVAVPLHDGELGVAPGRTPLIGRLGYGELRTRVGSEVRRFFIDGGFVQIRDDVVTVLTNRAIKSTQIDAVAAARELAIAQGRKPSNEYEQNEKARAVSRARALVRLGQSSA